MKLPVAVVVLVITQSLCSLISRSGLDFPLRETTPWVIIFVLSK